LTTNNLTSESLKDFCLKILKKELKGRKLEQRFKELSQLVGDRQYVLGKTFYSVSKFLNIDIDQLCIKVFKDYKWRPLSNVGEFQTKIQAFIYPYVNSSNTISAAAGIEKTRFSRLQKGELKELYADEIYGLAKAFGLKPSQLFDYFYGDGERPVVFYGSSKKT